MAMPDVQNSQSEDLTRFCHGRQARASSGLAGDAPLAYAAPVAYNTGMTGSNRSRSELLAVLRAHEAELRARGVETLTLFGSIARGDATGASDVDLAVRPGVGFSAGGFDHFGRLDALRDHLSTLLGCEVDLVEETAARARLRQVIEREGVRAF
jgi:predicted nucleotidyltransferase